jgi:hypothetical protein
VGKAVSIEKERTLRLAREIERELRLTGARELRVPITEVEDPARWRRAAVMASHRIGFVANTLKWGRTLVLLVHKPVTEAESRWAAEVTTDLLLPAGWRPR